MRKDKLKWEFAGEHYEVGNTINEEWDNRFFDCNPDRNQSLISDLEPLVWYRGNCFRLVKRSSNNRCLLRDIYTGSLLWKSQSHVFQVLKSNS